MKSESVPKKARIKPLSSVCEAIMVVRCHIDTLRTDSSYVDVLEVKKGRLEGGGIEFWHDIDGHNVGGSRDVVWVDFIWVHIGRGVPVVIKKNKEGVSCCGFDFFIVTICCECL